MSSIGEGLVNGVMEREAPGASALMDASQLVLMVQFLFVQMALFPNMFTIDVQTKANHAVLMIRNLRPVPMDQRQQNLQNLSKREDRPVEITPGHHVLTDPGQGKECARMALLLCVTAEMDQSVQMDLIQSGHLLVQFDLLLNIQVWEFYL